MSEESKEFKPITTQEELNSVIGDRIKRAKEAAAEKYADYDQLKAHVTEYEARIADLVQAADATAAKYANVDQTIAELRTKVAGYETASVKSRIAHEVGLPYGMSDRLVGSTESEIRADAESLKRAMGATQTPLASTETKPGKKSNGDVFADWLGQTLKNKGDS